MIGFPYNYGDQLTEEKAIDNFKLFVKIYGPTIGVNVLFFLISKTAYASENNNGAPTPKTDPKPDGVAPAPVFKPLLPPTKLVHSKLWVVGGIGAITWICITAASTGSPALIFACSSLLLYDAFRYKNDSRKLIKV
jgi:hypothetical protein